ncbi:hypothetical protein HDU83_004694 [Entophlyctis luteolus]|nr:hypothetical protein HDU83_004694 [Entophlyctis luteolus]KAJ3380103.1 hypothetical protein HDU84_006178 [Entophlyctis sp. JEL0112]
MSFLLALVLAGAARACGYGGGGAWAGAFVGVPSALSPGALLPVFLALDAPAARLALDWTVELGALAGGAELTRIVLAQKGPVAPATNVDLGLANIPAALNLTRDAVYFLVAHAKPLTHGPNHFRHHSPWAPTYSVMSRLNIVSSQFGASADFEEDLSMVPGVVKSPTCHNITEKAALLQPRKKIVVLDTHFTPGALANITFIITPQVSMLVSQVSVAIFSTVLPAHGSWAEKLVLSLGVVRVIPASSQNESYSFSWNTPLNFKERTHSETKFVAVWASKDENGNSFLPWGPAPVFGHGNLNSDSRFMPKKQDEQARQAALRQAQTNFWKNAFYNESFWTPEEYNTIRGFQNLEKLYQNNFTQLSDADMFQNVSETITRRDTLFSDSDGLRLLITFADIASIAYCNADDIILWGGPNCQTCEGASSLDYTPSQTYPVEVFQAGVFWATASLQCFLALFEPQQQIVVSFRGSFGPEPETFYIDLNGVLVTEKLLGLSRVHYGFQLSTEALWNKYSSSLKNLITAHPTYDIVFTGHSLGGALATLGAWWCYNTITQTRQRVKLRTYGAPRVGDSAFVQALGNANLYTWRGVNNQDAVPWIFPPFNGLNGGYMHGPAKYWIDPAGNPYTCGDTYLTEAAALRSCSPTGVVSFSDHTVFMGVPMGSKGCTTKVVCS